jgi:hypothetical protein
MKLGEAMYKAQGQAARCPRGRLHGDDDVVDAEFEEVDDTKTRRRARATRYVKCRIACQTAAGLSPL